MGFGCTSSTLRKLGSFLDTELLRTLLALKVGVNVCGPICATMSAKWIREVLIKFSSGRHPRPIMTLLNEFKRVWEFLLS